MKLGKLFGVLVIGGSMLVGAGCVDDGDPDDKKKTGTPDASQLADADPVSSTDANPNAPDATPGEEPKACFCDSEPCCTRDESGSGTVQDGFECCWSTTC